MGKWNDFRTITCRCGRTIYKDSDLFRLSCYSLKKPTQIRTGKNEKILEESFLFYICPQCDREVIVIKRKALNAANNKKVLLPVKLTGREALEYLELTKNNRIDKTHELTYCDTSKFVKGLSMSYFKTINKTHQRPRYLNEAGYSGEKVECKLKVYS